MGEDWGGTYTHTNTLTYQYHDQGPSYVKKKKNYLHFVDKGGRWGVGERECARGGKGGSENVDDFFCEPFNDTVVFLLHIW